MTINELKKVLNGLDQYRNLNSRSKQIVDAYLNQKANIRNIEAIEMLLQTLKESNGIS